MVKPIRYTIEVLRNGKWHAESGDYCIDEARTTLALRKFTAMARITATLEDGRKVVVR